MRGVAVDEVTRDAVSFALTVRGDPDALRQAIRREGLLVPVDEARMIFALAPWMWQPRSRGCPDFAA